MKTMEEIEWIGERRQSKVYKFLSKLYSNFQGYEVYNNSGSHAGPDILIKHNGKDFAVIEVTNYRQSSNMTHSRLLRYITNLERYNCSRLLIVSYPENLRYAVISYKDNLKHPRPEQTRINLAEKLLAKHGIKLSYFGYQD